MEKCFLKIASNLTCHVNTNRIRHDFTGLNQNDNGNTNKIIEE